jgi:hypothetical protein
MAKKPPKPAPPRPLYADLEQYIVALSKFSNRWCRHDPDCASNNSPVACTCGYDLAVRRLADILLQKYPDALHLKLAVNQIEATQRVIA